MFTSASHDRQLSFFSSDLMSQLDTQDPLLILDKSNTSSTHQMARI